MNKEALELIIQEAVEITFSRAGGPGGQNVNKVNTKVTARLKINTLAFLSEEELDRLKTALKNRITNEQELVVQVQDKRNQAQNRKLAVERMAALILNALVVRKKRKRSKPSAASKEARLQHKKRQSQKKQRRSLL